MTGNATCVPRRPDNSRDGIKPGSPSNGQKAAIVAGRCSLMKLVRKLLMDVSMSCRSDSSSCLRSARSLFRREDFFDFWLVPVFMDFLIRRFWVSGSLSFRNSGPILINIHLRIKQQAEHRICGMKNPPWGRFGPVTLNQVVQVGRPTRHQAFREKRTCTPVLGSATPRSVYRDKAFFGPDGQHHRGQYRVYPFQPFSASSS
jgi:hypothetical protein